MGTWLSDRALIRLSGADVRSFLQALVTNDVAGPLPVWAGLLTPQGKVLFDFIIWDDGDDLLIDCEATAVDALIRRLCLYRLRRPIEIRQEDVLAVHWQVEDGTGIPDPRLGALGRRWLAAAAAPASGWLEHRLALGVCEGADELGYDKILWLEANAAELNGVSFTKGCYVGQENTARMNWRGNVNRRLVVVHGTSGADAMAFYPKLGLAVQRRRVEAIRAAADNIIPGWLAPALRDAPERAEIASDPT